MQKIGVRSLNTPNSSLSQRYRVRQGKVVQSVEHEFQEALRFTDKTEIPWLATCMSIEEADIADLTSDDHK
jgi:hypothetical protein